MTNLQVSLREHKLAYTFTLLKKILSDTLWELSVQSIRLIPYPTTPIPRTCQMLILSGTECQHSIIWKAWWGATDRSRHKHTYLKNISKEEQLITGGKGKYTFHLNRKRNSFRLVVSSLIQKSENTFSPQENRGPLSYLFKKTKVYCMKQTIAFQSRVLFLSLASMRRIAGKCVLWELTPSARG